MDGKTFPNGPGLYYSNPYFLGGDTYKGPYTDPNGQQQAVSVDGNNIIIKMSKPFPDFPYYASFPAMGPIPTDPAVNDPAKYAQHPLATGPYKIAQYTIGEVADAGPQRPVGPEHRPRAHELPGQVRASRPVGRTRRPTRSCSTTPVPARRR